MSREGISWKQTFFIGFEIRPLNSHLEPKNSANQSSVSPSWVHTFNFKLTKFPESDCQWISSLDMWVHLFEILQERTKQLLLCQKWRDLLCSILLVWALEVQTHHMELSRPRELDFLELHVLRSSPSNSTTNLSSTYSPRSRTCPCRICSGPCRCQCPCPTTRTTTTLV